MTQALNLALFANKLNASGATDNTGLQNSTINIATTSPITGGANTSLGGTVTISHANSGVTASSYTNANITVNAQGHITAASSGTAAVTLIATGNGLQGGPITSTGTLSVACPTFNTVGSYATAVFRGEATYNSGSNYSAGTGAGQIGDNLSGTWKYMGAYQINLGESSTTTSLVCRVS